MSADQASGTEEIRVGFSLAEGPAEMVYGKNRGAMPGAPKLVHRETIFR